MREGHSIGCSMNVGSVWIWRMRLSEMRWSGWERVGQQGRGGGGSGSGTNSTVYRLNCVLNHGWRSGALELTAGPDDESALPLSVFSVLIICPDAVDIHM
jgi:hypothetical protein